MLTEMYDHMRKVNLINRKMRRHEMKGTAIKTGVISATFSTVLQEALAMFNNPDTRGLIESIMGRDTDAKSTTLITGVWESLQGWFRRNTEAASDMVDKAIDSSAMNPAGLIAQIAPAVQVETNLMGRVKAFIIEKVWPFRWAIAAHADKFMGDLDNQIKELQKSYQSTASPIPFDDMTEAIKVRALGNVLRQYGL